MYEQKSKSNFVNLAYGGFTTYHVLPSGCTAPEKIQPDTARNITKALSYKPTLVIISLPNNDVANNYTNKEIVENFGKLTHILDSSKIQYIVFSTQPRDFTTLEQRRQITTLNDTLKAVYGYHFNDFLAALSDTDYFIKPEVAYGDAVHINNAGHTIIFNAISKHALLTNSCKCSVSN
ncbi:SGNH/GDSL hydrolase family protein [Mucilaginibacter antarcticus]|uniref:SGNH/GDSL hydrolase family protein n=1 Tax=Mucilaginibacter antarcticus TaxID=1855725 RepID=UPI003629FAAF